MKKLNIKRILVSALAAAASLSLAACGSSGNTNGYNNMVTLQTSIQTRVNQRLVASGSAVQTTDVSCFVSAPQTANCQLTANDGSKDTVIATVSPDGNSFSTPGSYTPGQ